MIHITTVIGARPQIIKAAALSRAIRTRFSDQISETIIHTGQHYDENMSQIFFEELNIPAANINLNVGSASHGKQTASMIQGLEEILTSSRPDYLILYGDTNSTLAGAIAASKLHIPIAHIEAGLRSFNKSMPEEINRIMCDHVSTLLFCPTITGYNNLINEGFKAKNTLPPTIDNPKIYNGGDVMYDNSLYFADLAADKSSILKDHKLIGKPFILTTLHRDSNTDFPERLTAIFKAINKISLDENIDFVMPLHPRTTKLLPLNLDKDIYEKTKVNPNIHIIPPVSFLDMILLEKSASMILTDSGGVQKEAFFFKKPCLIMRSESEWVEIVESGSAIIVNADENKILKGFEHFKNNSNLKFPDVFGDGHASEFICEQLLLHALKK